MFFGSRNLAHRNEDVLVSAWRALSSQVVNSRGWHSIPLSCQGPCSFRAARQFPENQEALLIGLQPVRIPISERLPDGQGFGVSAIDLGTESSGRTWFALSRRNRGSLDMFTLMAVDIITTLESYPTSDPDKPFRAFLARIRAWQDFMRRGTETILDPKSELGLFGELTFLRSILQAGLGPHAAIEGWVGPLGGMQDFSLGGGAIEVKTTAASEGFVATILCLNQLDESMTSPLFLAAVRIASDAIGVALPALVEDIRTHIGEIPGVQSTFTVRLIHSGYVDSMAHLYHRAFVHVSTRVLEVGEHFPRLTRSHVPPAIIEARYEIDLDQIREEVPIAFALQRLGML